MDLSQAQRDQSWSDFLENANAPTYPSGLDGEQRELYKQSQRLLKAWQNFVQKLPPDQRPDAAARPSLDTVRSAIQRSYEAREAKRKGTVFGKANALLGSLIEQCNDYSFLLAVIPDGDKYISVITGSVSAIAQAYMNDAAIGEAIIEALGAVDVEVEFWKRRIVNHRENPIMRRYIIQLFVYMFELHTDVFITWSASSWDRFKQSLNKNYIKQKIDSKVASMRSLAKRLSDEAEFTQESRLFLMDSAVSSIHDKVDLIVRQLAQIGNGNIQIIVNSPGRPSPTKTSMASSPDHATSPGVLPPGSDQSELTWSTELQLITSKAADMIENLEDNSITSLYQKISPAHLPSSAIVALRTWCSNAESDMVWIEDASDAELPSKATRVATTVNHLALTQAGRLPVVSFSCNSLQMKGLSATSKLVQLLHGIILQLGDHISVQDLITLDPSFSTDFLALSHESSDTALPLSVLARLLVHKPKFMFFLVDGLQVLDRHDGFEKLLEILSSAVAERGAGSVLKVLLSSDGHVGSLSKCRARGGLRHIALEPSRTFDEDDMYAEELEYDL